MQNDTLTNLIQRVIRRVGQVSGGIGAQRYSEDTIEDMIRQKFMSLFSQTFWPQFMQWATWALDGSTGIVTTDPTGVTNPLNRFADIRAVFDGTSNRTLRRIPANLNPAGLVGTTKRYIEPNATRIFRVLPIASTGNVTVHYRSLPSSWYQPEATVPFDAEALVLGAAWDYLSDDASNPDAIDKLKMLYEARITELKSELSIIDGDLNPSETLSGVMDGWFEPRFHP